MFATDGIWREAEATSGDWRATIRSAMIASLVLALSIGAFLCVRRLGGAIEKPLDPLSLIALAATLILWATALRLRLRERRFAWLAALAMALFAVACSAPGERAIDWLVWLSAFAIYGMIPATPARLASASKLRSPAIGVHEPAEVLLQQLSRSRTAEGGEIVRGTLAAEFRPGERVATLHVAFCPPFESIPDFDAEAVEGADCDVNVTQVLHHGAQLEVRLARASTAHEHVTVEFLATVGRPVAV